MRFLPSLMVTVVAMFCSGCGGPPSDSQETAADEVQESIETSLDKAEGVEDLLQDAADARDAAIEESSDNK